MGCGVADRSRITAAVVGLARLGLPGHTVLLDDVTLSNAGLREGHAVIVSAVTVYGARSVTLSGSTLASQSIAAATPAAGLALQGDDRRRCGVAAASRSGSRHLDLGGQPGTCVGGRDQLDVGAADRDRVDPEGPVSVQPNSQVGWGAGVPVSAGPSKNRSASPRRRSPSTNSPSTNSKAHRPRPPNSPSGSSSPSTSRTY